MVQSILNGICPPEEPGGIEKISYLKFEFPVSFPDENELVDHQLAGIFQDI